MTPAWYPRPAPLIEPALLSKTARDLRARALRRSGYVVAGVYRFDGERVSDTPTYIIATRKQT